MIPVDKLIPLLGNLALRAVGIEKYTDDDLEVIRLVRKEYEKMQIKCKPTSGSNNSDDSVEAQGIPLCLVVRDGDSVWSMPKESLEKLYWIVHIRRNNGLYSAVIKALNLILKFEKKRFSPDIFGTIEAKHHDPVTLVLFELKQWLSALTNTRLDQALESEINARLDYLENIREQGALRKKFEKYSKTEDLPGLFIELTNHLNDVILPIIQREIKAASAETSIKTLGANVDMLVVDILEQIRLCLLPEEKSKIDALLREIEIYHECEVKEDMRQEVLFLLV